MQIICPRGEERKAIALSLPYKMILWRQLLCSWQIRVRRVPVARGNVVELLQSTLWTATVVLRWRITVECVFNHGFSYPVILSLGSTQGTFGRKPTQVNSVWSNFNHCFIMRPLELHSVVVFLACFECIFVLTELPKRPRLAIDGFGHHFPEKRLKCWKTSTNETCV